MEKENTYSSNLKVISKREKKENSLFKEKENEKGDDYISDDKKNNKKYTKLKQRLIFLPIISIIITLGGFEWFYYFRYSLNNKKKIKNCGFFILFCYINIMLNYLLSVFTNSIQTNLEEILKNEENKLQYNINKYQNEIIDEKIKNENYNYCEFCKKPKFIRSSHCRICNICTIGRDHHCPYIANCVGYKNYQFFINFLIWGIIDISLVIFFFIFFLFKYPIFLQQYPNFKISTFLWVLLILFNTGLGIINYYLFRFLKSILYGIYNNRTMVEGIRKDIEMNKVCKNSRNYTIYNPYNIGYLSHYYNFIGNTLLHFFFPIPKFRNYNIIEENPIFQKCKQPSKISILKMVITNEEDVDDILNSKENEPNEFLKISRRIYRGKKII